MAKQTAAQKKAEYAAQVAQRQAEEVQAYLPRVMRALEEATTVCFMELKVTDGYFMVKDTAYREEYAFGLTYSEESAAELEELEYELRRQQDQRAEAARLQALKQQARAKLSKEELQALGL